MQTSQKQPLILTLRLDEASQAFFDRQRTLYFPAGRNFLKAHVTLFHQLPDERPTFAYLRALRLSPFVMEISGMRFLGAGVAYQINSTALLDLHKKLKDHFADQLIPQDKQRFNPHITIQNKVEPETAKKLMTALAEDFKPFAVTAKGLELWRYLGGPWELLHSYHFG